VVQPSVPSTGGVGAAPGSEQDFMLNVGRRVFFAEGSAALDSTARATIRNQVQWLKANPQWKAKIQGFADDPGGDAQQTALSQKRADAVKNDMVSQGIAASRIWAKGYGRDRLVGDCAELECKAQNRRTVTNLQDGTEAQ
jgi:peptidoglycan-associated lipoprotein